MTWRVLQGGRMNYCGSQVRRQLWRVRRRRGRLGRNRGRVARVLGVGRHRGCLSSTTVDALCQGHLSLQEVAHRLGIPDFTLAGSSPRATRRAPIFRTRGCQVVTTFLAQRTTALVVLPRGSTVTLPPGPPASVLSLSCTCSRLTAGGWRTIPRCGEGEPRAHTRGGVSPGQHRQTSGTWT
jgi:hypothetical protein